MSFSFSEELSAEDAKNTEKLTQWRKEVQGVLDVLQKENKEKDDTIKFLKKKLVDAQKGTANVDKTSVIKGLESTISDLEKQINNKNDVIRNLQRTIVKLGQQFEGEDRDVANLRAHWEGSQEDDVPVHKENNDRFAISAETFQGPQLTKSKQKKTAQERNFISTNLKATKFFGGLDFNQMNQLVDCMRMRKFKAETMIIQQGDFGDEMYLIMQGEVDILIEKEGKTTTVCTLGAGTVFGELAILYNCKRTASCKAKSACSVWAIDRKSVQTIVKFMGQERLEEYVRLLLTVDKLKHLPRGTLMRIADCFEAQTYQKGDYIIREGDYGDIFYVIQQGKVKVTKNAGGSEVFLADLGKGDYFGERALLTEDKRSANVISNSDDLQLLMLDREDFVALVGNITEIRAQEDDLDTHAEEVYDEIMDNLRVVEEQNFKVLTPTRADSELVSSCPLNKLQMLAVLGEGGFGFVKLCKVPGLNKSSFALKSIKKAQIVKQGQQEHVRAEKEIQESLKSPFCGRLYRCYKDETRIYMLMDAYLGGELYGVLRKVGALKDGPARFCAACTIEALSFLHDRGIVYRDLKPENLMVDHKGYVILIDFGFAKKVHRNKTFTFCGTPEYFPPEVLNNAGHDISADYWSYGILIYELLTMTTPFYADSDMTIYENILGGIEGVRFSGKVKKHAESLIRALCKLEPRERLGNMKGGIQDIRKHRWFSSFDWKGLQTCQLESPFDPDVTGPLDIKHFPKVTGSSGETDTDKELQLLAKSNMAWDAIFAS